MVKHLPRLCVFSPSPIESFRPRTCTDGNQEAIKRSEKHKSVDKGLYADGRCQTGLEAGMDQTFS